MKIEIKTNTLESFELIDVLEIAREADLIISKRGKSIDNYTLVVGRNDFGGVSVSFSGGLTSLGKSGLPNPNGSTLGNLIRRIRNNEEWVVVS